MKRSFLHKAALSVMITLTVLFFLSTGFSAKYVRKLNVPNNNVTLNEELIIDYEVRYDGEEGKLVIELSNDENTIELLSQTITGSVEDKLVWNVSNTPAGEYELKLIVTEEGSSFSGIEEVIIRPAPRLSVSFNEYNLFAFQDESAAELTLKNEGNVPLRITHSFMKFPDTPVSVDPSTFLLSVSEEKRVRVTVTKPTNNYDFITKFSGEYENNVVSQETLFHVVKPISNLELTNVSFTQKGNHTVFTATLTNTGNIPQEPSFTIKSFTLQELMKAETSTRVEPNQTIIINESLPIKGVVYALKMDYKNTDLKVTSKAWEYPVFLGLTIPEPLLQLIVTVMNNELLRGGLIALTLVIAVIILFKLSKKALFRKKK